MITIVVVCIVGVIIEMLRYRRKRVLSVFLYTNTVLPLNAKQWKELKITDMLAAKMLLRTGLLKETEGERFYLDLQRRDEMDWHRIRFIQTATFAGILFLFGVLVYLLFRFAT